MTGSYSDADTIERPWADLDRVVWRGSDRPKWLAQEPCAATLPMPPERFTWCLHAIGWERALAARRACAASSTSFKRYERANKVIPDKLAIWLESQVTRALTPVEGTCVPFETERGFVGPAWLKPEWCPPTRPMITARMMWCLSVIGWSYFETSRRFRGVTEREIHEMIERTRDVPDDFADWLEVHTRRVLEGELTPPGWGADRPDLYPDYDDYA